MIQLTIDDVPPSPNELRREYRHPHAYKRLREAWEWMILAAPCATHRLQLRNAAKKHRMRVEVTLYHHRVNLAFHEWLSGNVVRSGQLLDDCRPDLRHWEWRYVRRLCDSSLFTCVGHSTHVMSVAFSKDGKQFASASGRCPTPCSAGSCRAATAWGRSAS